MKSSQVTPGASKPIDVRLGDALLMWKEDGKSRGQKIDAGKDACLQIPLKIDGRAVMQPFTGAAMLVARERLRNRQAEGFPLTPDQERALDGIQGVLDIILADPDPSRFDPAVIGNAFAAAMTDAVGPIALPVSPEDLGRKARADLLRARISRIDPDHPDGFCTLRSLDGILDELGIETAVPEWAPRYAAVGGR